MRKIGLILGFLLIGTLGVSFAKTDIGSMDSAMKVNSYIVKEVGSSEILMSKNKDKRIEPASLTKILTSIIAIESGRLTEDVTIPREATLVEPSKAGFRAGDKIKLIDLVKAAMVNSSNDAAFAIAIHLGGNVQEFARVMNYKARLIGMTSSNFTNPAGFDRGVYANHYSTAGDLLTLTEYAIKNRLFNEIAKLESVAITEQATGKQFYLKTHNRLLDKYKYAVGIKTGYTSRAGKCLIARAQKDNKDVVLVMLKAKTDRWNTAEDMFEKAFTMDRPEPELIDDKEYAEPVSKRVSKKAVKVSKKVRVSSKKAAPKANKKRLKVASKAKSDKS
ncbi:MAG: penicillin-binding transpeptidase domain-containing protein, partial [Campylobacterales bacterium]|nr:penicillin-binding transpeptidase domain-containing protein [Campylobacterales bacterium]